jgi:hypothetical protein
MRVSTKIRLAVVLLAMAATQSGLAQATAPTASASPELLDSVVALVNDDVLLESDVEEEERFAAFEPFTTAGAVNPRQEALGRLIDRTLVGEQMRRQAVIPEISDEQLNKELMQVRKTLPECVKYACTTDAGWEDFCRAHGFSTEQIAARWQLRMQLLKFIEQRFKTGIRISEVEIQQYYDQTFVPQFRERKLTPPPLTSISDRIEEILLQQRVNVLLEEWLKSLHDQGSVQILDPSLIPAGTSPVAAPAGNLPMPGSGLQSTEGGLLP